MAAEPGMLRWEKPAPSWVNCNIVVAFVIGFRTTSLGLYFRDSNDQFKTGMSMTQWQEFVISTLEGEAHIILYF
jgi:hypothetical protein